MWAIRPPDPGSSSSLEPPVWCGCRWSAATWASSKLSRHEWLPSIVQLTEETGLTAKTIQRAMRLLESEGLVRVRPNRGTFVR